MPGIVTLINVRHPGTYVVLEAVLPGRAPRSIGVLLVNPAADRAFFRMRTGFDDIADADDAEVLSGLARHIEDCVADAGASAVLRYLEDTASNSVRITDPQTIEVDAFSRALERLYSDNVEPVPIAQFRTHVPLFSLQAAAGDLGDEMESRAEDWIPAPEGMRLTPDLFAGHVVGHSMEPRIPDGSLNLFRLNPQGSRQGKILLIERFGVTDETARYTIKRYTSRKRSTGEDQWEHEQIRLEPLNPEYEPWDVEPDGFAVVAEWLRVIE